MKPTCKQQAVIDERTRDIVVTASAGTGKTKTMVDRVLAIIKDGNPLSSIAMLTYNDAAAAEMRYRVRDALMKELKATNDSLEREKFQNALDEVPLFACSTMHSFCFNIVKENFEVLGIAPNPSVISEDTAVKVKNEIMQDLLKETYKDAAKGESLKALATYVNIRDDKQIIQDILVINEFVNSLEDKQAWLTMAKEEIGKPLDETRVFKWFISQTRKKANELVEKLKTAILDLDGGANPVEAQIKKRFEQYCNAFELCENWKNCHDIEVSGDAFPKQSIIKKDFCIEAQYIMAKPLLEEGEKFYKHIKTITKTISKDEFDYNVQRPIKYTFLDLLEEFSKRYAAKKRKLGVVDYSDMEQFALQVLTNDNIAEAVKKYDYIIVDEFQDINPIQDKIVTCISSGKNLCVVGDQKQSIYRFRLADPNIFKRRLGECGTDDNVPTRKDLNENFRCSVSVCDFVNELFSKLMTEERGKVDYENEAKLEHHKDAIEGEVVGHFYSVEKESPEKNASIYSVKEDLGSDENDTSNALYEARWIKKQIDETVKNDGDYSKIMMLFFKRTNSKLILEYLENHGVPLDCSDLEKESKSEDVNLLVNFVRLLDNPDDDYSWLSVLFSPMFNLSANDLMEIKDQDSFSHSLFNKRKDGRLNATIMAAMDYVDEMRFVLSYTSLPEIIRKVAEDKLYIPLKSLPDGDERISEIKEFILNIEAQSFLSLADFLNFYDNAYEGEKGGVEGSANTIKVMTVHKSKGLEAPVVILPLLSQQIRDKAETKGHFFLRDQDLGLHCKSAKDDSNSNQKPGLCCENVVEKHNIENIEDKLRLFYVATTRAKEKLIFCGCINQDFTDGTSWPTIDKAKTFAEWILAAFGKAPKEYYECVRAQDNNFEDSINVRANMELAVLKKQLADSASILNETYSRAEKRYNAESTKMGIKFTVTGINSGVGNFSVQTPISIYDSEEAHTIFDGQKVEKGTAMHCVMEHMSFLENDESDIKKKVEHLVSCDVITKEDSEIIDYKKILNAINVLKPIAKGKEVRQEQKFILRMPANEAGIKGATIANKVSIQGKIDLLLTDKESKTCVIVDYKLSSHDAEYLKTAYKKQLDLYERAARKSIDDGETYTIDKYILSLYTGELIKVD